MLSATGIFITGIRKKPNQFLKRSWSEKAGVRSDTLQLKHNMLKNSINKENP